MPEVMAYVGHLTPDQIKLLVAVDRRMREIFAVEKRPLCVYADITPVVIGLSFELFPKISAKRRQAISWAICDFISQQADALHRTAGQA